MAERLLAIRAPQNLQWLCLYVGAAERVLAQCQCDSSPTGRTAGCTGNGVQLTLFACYLFRKFCKVTSNDAKVKGVMSIIRCYSTMEIITWDRIITDRPEAARLVCIYVMQYGLHVCNGRQKDFYFSHLIKYIIIVRFLRFLRLDNRSKRRENNFTNESRN